VESTGVQDSFFDQIGKINTVVSKKLLEFSELIKEVLVGDVSELEKEIIETIKESNINFYKNSDGYLSSYNKVHLSMIEYVLVYDKLLIFLKNELNQINNAIISTNLGIDITTSTPTLINGLTNNFSYNNDNCNNNGNGRDDLWLLDQNYRHTVAQLDININIFFSFDNYIETLQKSLHSRIESMKVAALSLFGYEQARVWKENGDLQLMMSTKRSSQMEESSLNENINEIQNKRNISETLKIDRNDTLLSLCGFSNLPDSPKIVLTKKMQLSSSDAVKKSLNIELLPCTYIQAIITSDGYLHIMENLDLINNVKIYNETYNYFPIKSFIINQCEILSASNEKGQVINGVEIKSSTSKSISKRLKNILGGNQNNDESIVLYNSDASEVYSLLSCLLNPFSSPCEIINDLFDSIEDKNSILNYNNNNNNNKFQDETKLNMLLNNISIQEFSDEESDCASSPSKTPHKKNDQQLNNESSPHIYCSNQSPNSSTNDSLIDGNNKTIKTNNLIETKSMDQSNNNVEVNSGELLDYNNNNIKKYSEINHITIYDKWTKEKTTDDILVIEKSKPIGKVTRGKAKLNIIPSNDPKAPLISNSKKRNSLILQTCTNLFIYCYLLLLLLYIIIVYF
jgi:hypothetical protein